MTKRASKPAERRRRRAHRRARDEAGERGLSATHPPSGEYPVAVQGDGQTYSDIELDLEAARTKQMRRKSDELRFAVWLAMQAEPQVDEADEILIPRDGKQADEPALDQTRIDFVRELQARTSVQMGELDECRALDRRLAYLRAEGLLSREWIEALELCWSFDDFIQRLAARDILLPGHLHINRYFPLCAINECGQWQTTEFGRSVWRRFQRRILRSIPAILENAVTLPNEQVAAKYYPLGWLLDLMRDREMVDREDGVAHGEAA